MNRHKSPKSAPYLPTSHDDQIVSDAYEHPAHKKDDDKAYRKGFGTSFSEKVSVALHPHRIVVKRWVFTYRRLPLHFQLALSVMFLIAGSSLVSWSLRPDEYKEFRNRPKDIPHSWRIIQLGETANVASRLESDALPPSGVRVLVQRYITLPRGQARQYKAASTLDKGQCQRTADWQTSHNPSCNKLHENSGGFISPLGPHPSKVPHFHSPSDDSFNLFEDPHEQLRLGGNGAYRMVWMIREWDGTRRALKTLVGDSDSKDFDLRNTDRHRRDAVSMEQLTASPLVVDIYGYSSNSALFDWGEGGDLESLFDREPNISKEKLLHIAYNVSLSVHHAHNFDEKGRATIARTDIKTDQFLYQNGYYRLTDFNRARFLMWNNLMNKPCGFKVSKNGGNWRSPEEYSYESERETVDVYSLGNVLYYLLTEEEVWHGYRNKEIYRKVIAGKRPLISGKIRNSTHPFDKFMVEAIEMAWTHDQYKRPGALAVANKLQEGIDLLGSYVGEPTEDNEREDEGNDESGENSEAKEE